MPNPPNDFEAFYPTMFLNKTIRIAIAFQADMRWGPKIPIWFAAIDGQCQTIIFTAQIKSKPIPWKGYSKNDKPCRDLDTMITAL
jgi:hypothetical protein